MVEESSCRGHLEIGLSLISYLEREIARLAFALIVVWNCYFFLLVSVRRETSLSGFIFNVFVLFDSISADDLIFNHQRNLNLNRQREDDHVHLKNYNKLSKSVQCILTVSATGGSEHITSSWPTTK